MRTTLKLKWATAESLTINRRPCVGREEYLDYMTFQSNDRPLFTETFGPMVGLKEEWEQQGATPEELNFSAFPYRCEARYMIPVNTENILRDTREVLEDTDEYLLYRDGLGRRMKIPKGVATLPMPLDWPVKTMDDWLKIKPLYEFSEERLAGDWAGEALRQREQGKVICVGIPGGFDEPRQLLGEEELCLAYYEQPELIHDIVKTMGDTAFRVLDRVSAEVPIDLLSTHEDMAGRNGPLIGPELTREYVLPYYRRIWDMLQDRGARLFENDSDGDINVLMDVFLDAGINSMRPLEPVANMDIVKLREKYGNRLALTGGLDKHVIRRSKEEIVQELEYKIPPMIEAGGCVLGLDHRIPTGTSLENYRFYIEQVWNILGR